MTTNKTRRERRSVSVTSDTYDRLKAYADQQGVSVAAVVDAMTSDVGRVK